MPKFVELKRIPKAQTPAEWLTATIDASGMKVAEVAEALGVRPNVVSVWKSGKQDIPSVRLAQMARMMGADVIYVRNLKYAEEEWDTWAQDERIRHLGRITENEYEFLKILRQSKLNNPKMNEEQKKQFAAFVETLEDSIAGQEFDPQAAPAAKPKRG